MSRVSWRWYDHARDAEQVKRLHAEMEARIGRRFDLPDFAPHKIDIDGNQYETQRPILGVVVGETNGQVTHGLYGEAEVEMAAIGCSPLSARDARGAEALLLPTFMAYDLRIARAFLPSTMLTPGKNGRPSPMARTLKSMGFTQENDVMKQWFRWLATEKEGS